MSKAKTRLSNATFVERGFSVVEPNHLSAQRTGQVYAQLPANKDIEVLENGQFVKYDYAAGECNFTGDGPWMMVWNEVKLYEDYMTDADWAMKREDYSAYVYDATGADMPEDTVMTPRVIRIEPGDIYTTNCVKETTLAVGDKLMVGADGYLAKTGDTTGPTMKVVKVYTMPDMQQGVKLQCIK